MKPHVFVSLVLSIAIVFPAVGTVVAQRQPIAQMLRVEGKVELKSIGQPTYRPVKIDEMLFHGDLVRATPGSRGVFRCLSDATTWTVPADNLPRGVANTCSPARG